MSSTKQVAQDKKLWSSKNQESDLSEVPKLNESKIGKIKRYTWSTSSIELFFEGLMQHGKDFPKILEHIRTKQRSSGLTKDQVRFFYYRTWHKVSLLLTDSDVSYDDGDVPLDSSLDENEENPKTDMDSKTSGISEGVSYSPCVDTEQKENKRRDTLWVNGAQYSLDLVALICYWKLKQKFPVGDQNFGRKLSDLVFSGTTTVPGRTKGKRRCQLKIPSCGAFRGFAAEDGLDKDGDQDQMPTYNSGSLTVELRPLTSSSWLKVQRNSINPRLRLRTYSSRDVNSLLVFARNHFSISTKDTIEIHLFEESGVHCESNCDCRGTINKLQWQYEGSLNSHGPLCQGLLPSFFLGDIFENNSPGSYLKLFYEIKAEGEVCDFQVGKLLKFASFLDSSTLFQKTGVGYSPAITDYLQSLNKKKQLRSPLLKYKNYRVSSPKRLRPKVFVLDKNSKRSAHTKTTKDRIRQIIPKALPFFPEGEYQDKELCLPEVPVGQSQSNVDLSAIDHEIKGAVVDNFLSVKPHTSEIDCFTSSDTVSELLKGFADEGSDKSGNASLEDAVQILPSFAKALNSYTCQGQSNSPSVQSSSKYEAKDSCTSLFEDSSCDYISKFKEIASSMEKHLT